MSSITHNRLLRYAVFLGVAISAAACGFWLRFSHDSAPRANASLASASDAIWTLRLPGFDNQAQSLSQWKGKVVVVNFWATWCGPCREEIPEFVKMQQELGGRGLQFVGISIDQVDKTREFSANFKINYPILIGGFDAVDVSQKAGNSKRGLPFTVVLDRKGNIVSTDLGGLTRAKLEAIVSLLL
jgi:thiol-disulfide isomerase/thioredoxin